MNQLITITSKVNGVWIPQHDTQGHKYFNKELNISQRSVTTKLQILAKPHLTQWAVRVGVEWLLKDDRIERLRNIHWKDEMVSGAQMAHLDIRDNAGLTGTKTHNIAEIYLNKWIETGERPQDIREFMDIDNDDPRAIAGARSFELLCNTKHIVPICSEIIVGHPKYSAGAIDILCLWENKLCLLDIKTSNSVDKNFRYQLAAYKYMFEYMTGIKIKTVKILHLSKDMDKYHIYNVKNLPQAWKTFKYICQVYDDIMSPKDKIVKDIKRIII